MSLQNVHPPIERGNFSPQATARRDVAKALEKAFIAEMLKIVDATSGERTLSGGIGEEQFRSFLNDEYARILSESGGVGLSELIMSSMDSGGSYED